MQNRIGQKNTSFPRLVSVNNGIYKYQFKHNVVIIDTPKIFKVASQFLKNGEKSYL